MTQLPEKPTVYRHFINGEWSEGSSGRSIERPSPAHDTCVSIYPDGSTEDAEAAIRAARSAFDEGPWPNTTGAEREVILRKTAAMLRESKDELGLIECLESGKPLTQARDEIDWAAGIWDYAAALARHLHGETTNTLGEGMLGLTLHEPIGVCALITPWNFPLLIISQKLPFALAAGCTCVVKPSEFTSGTTLRLVEILQRAGLPDGVCNVVCGYGDPVGRVFAESMEVDAVSFTGSTAVGKKIAAAAAGNLKKVSLELGGKNPQVIFADAELDAVVDAVVHGCNFNMGECCNSGSRILVEDSIADRLIEQIVDASRTLKTGDPLDPEVKLGAIINPAQHDKILRHVREAGEAGAVIRCGGDRIPSTKGHFFEVTVLDQVSADMSVARDEIFGPVLTVLRFTSEQEAVRIVNETSYGLSAAVWTRDFDRAMRMTRAIRAGTVWINTFLDGAPELPFGGYKQSGLGRELGPHSVLEYTETKTVAMRLGKYTHKWV